MYRNKARRPGSSGSVLDDSGARCHRRRLKLLPPVGKTDRGFVRDLLPDPVDHSMVDGGHR